MECIEARPLIPSYLDGELSEAQARPLRKHLLDCPECRSGAQGEKYLKRWFVQEEPVLVPRDFAARVARRAFAGDSGERFGAVPAAAAFEAPRDSYLRFILQVTSIAAVVLIFLVLDHSTSRENSTSDPALTAEINLLDEEIREGEAGKVAIRNTISDVDLQMVQAQGLATQIQQEIQYFHEELAEMENETLADQESIEKLKADIDSL